MNITIVPSEWWGMDFKSALDRATHLYLLTISDRDGICKLDTASMSDVLKAPRSVVFGSLKALEVSRYLIVWKSNDKHYGWVPHAVDWVPKRGTHSRKRDSSLPAPPRDKVIEALTSLWGREVAEKEAKQVCPRAWGKRASASSAESSEEQLLEVWKGWKNRQKRPEACRLTPSVKGMIKNALKEASQEHLLLLFEFAYEADAPGPKFWRGENDRGRTYLGLDNLLRVGKLQGRLQTAIEWKETNSKVGGDGTDLGPMAAFKRRGPIGTQSSPADKPKRLGVQAQTMLRLFVQRGDQGVFTSELAEIALKYSARISELRGVGCDILCSVRSADGNNMYILANAEMVGDNVDTFIARL